MIMMAPPLPNSFITMFVEIVVLVSSVIDKLIHKGVSTIGWSPICFTAVVVYRWFVGISIREKIVM